MSKAVLNYDEYLYEKKNNQDLASGSVKGSRINKQVNPNMAKLPTNRGKTYTKSTKSGLSNLPTKRGSSITKSVKSNISGLPKNKGKSPSKMVNTQTSSKLVIKGKPLAKRVGDNMAKMPYGKKVTPNAAVKKASPYKK